MNEKFNTNFEATNVENRLGWLQIQYKGIKTALQQSGAGWDDERKMVTMESETAEAYIQVCQLALFTFF